MQEPSGHAKAAFLGGRDQCMYVVVRNYTDEASDVVEQARQREESIKEVMRGIDGFVAYYLLDTQNGGLASVSVFEDRAGAEESTRAAAKWVRENIAEWAPNPPTVIQGEVAIDASR
jgi:heme-degrading monooxygenase HmoA